MRYEILKRKPKRSQSATLQASKHYINITMCQVSDTIKNVKRDKLLSRAYPQTQSCASRTIGKSKQITRWMIKSIRKILMISEDVYSKKNKKFRLFIILPNVPQEKQEVYKTNANTCEKILLRDF